MALVIRMAVVIYCELETGCREGFFDGLCFKDNNNLIKAPASISGGSAMVS